VFADILAAGALNKIRTPLQQDNLYTLSPNGNAFAYMHFIPVSRRPGALMEGRQNGITPPI
jgi:hypothetical protein